MALNLTNLSPKSGDVKMRSQVFNYVQSCLNI